LLEAIFERRGVFALLFLAFCGGSWLLLPLLGQDFFPNVDAGQIRLHVRTRSGTRVEETAKLVDLIETEIRGKFRANSWAVFWTTSASPTPAFPPVTATMV
jgi:multidrug efflux pump subunit AcrB